MTVQQMRVIRNHWEACHKPEETMTAFEMAFIPHDLSMDDNKATLLDGRVFYWDQSRDLWVK
jgi:hypothetical protein